MASTHEQSPAGAPGEGVWFPLRQERLDGLAAMDRGPIPTNQQCSRKRAQKPVHKAHTIWSFARMILNRHDHPSIHGQCSARGERIARSSSLAFFELDRMGVAPDLDGVFIALAGSRLRLLPSVRDSFEMATVRGSCHTHA
jgi:hypothetical protein